MFLNGFGNKMDRVGADFFEVLKEIEEELGANPIPMQVPIGKEDTFRGVVDLIQMKALIYEGEEKGKSYIVQEVPEDLKQIAKDYRHIMIEKAVEMDDHLMEKYLNDENSITAEEVGAAIRKGTIANKIVPVFCGTAFKNKGVQCLLDGVAAYLPSPLDLPPAQGTDPDDPEKKLERKADINEPFSALAFKIQADPHMGKLIYIRVYSGKMAAGTYVQNSTKDKKERVGRLLQMHANQREGIAEVQAGDIAAVVGLESTITGDTLCNEDNPILLEAIEFPAPVIDISIKPATRADQDKLAKGLMRLGEEDPTFGVHTDQETEETILSGMGELHLEIIVDRLKHEYGVDAVVGQPKVAYKETILVRCKNINMPSKPAAAVNMAMS